MKLFPNVQFAYDYVFSWTTIIATCDVMDNACCTIFKQIKLTVTMFIKVQKLFLVVDSTQNNNYNDVSKNIVGCKAFILAQTPKQVDM